MSAYQISRLQYPCSRPNLNSSGLNGGGVRGGTHGSGGDGAIIEASGIKKAIQAAQRLVPGMQAPYSLSRDEAEAYAGDEVISITKIA